jgi:GH24 family phage-related lysozyme (muramidase)
MRVLLLRPTRGVLCTAQTAASPFQRAVKCCIATTSSYGPCTANGKNGQCVSSCSGDHVASSAGANGCQSFPAAVKCCVASGGGGSTNGAQLPPGPACVAHGRGGSCIDRSRCPSPFTAYPSARGSVSGCESFADAIQCCSPGVPSNNGGNNGGNNNNGGSTGSARVPAAAIAIIKMFEGFYSRAYPDPRTGGKPITIGWGSTRRRDGSEFRLGDTISREDAEDLLMWQIETKYLPPQEQKIPGWSQLNSNQRSAIISFAYNLGANFYGLSGFRTISNVLKNREWSKIRAAFLLYRNPGSNVEAGLRRRRTAEADLFLKPVTNSAGLEEETEEIPQVELTAEDDVDGLDPSLHSDDSVAIGLGVTAAIIVLALIIAAVVWVCVGKRAKASTLEANSASSISMSQQPYKSSYTCNVCKTTFFAADDLTAHVVSAHP